jgi:hypothetical protein
MSDVDTSVATARVAIAAMSAEGMHHCARVADVESKSSPEDDDLI